MKTDKLEQIKNISSTNEKIYLATKYFSDKEHRFMTACFNDIIYGISEINIKKAINYKTTEKFEDLGDYIKNNPISIRNMTNITITDFIKEVGLYSGNNQMDTINKLFINRISKADAPWFIRILLKNPRIGISEINYNKIRINQGLKPLDKWFVKLAELIEEEKLSTLNYPLYVELKYDGERAIINYDNGNVNITSRNGNNITKQFPEIVKIIQAYFINSNINKIILDGEIISTSFNLLQKRMNRLESNLNTDCNLKFMCFDVLMINDDNYNTKSQFERRQILDSLNIEISESVVCNSINEILDFYYKAIKNKEEGIVIKEFAASVATKYNDRKNWYKMKPVYTSDLLIINADYGKGKNKDYINILYVMDKSGIIKTKVSSGMTDMLRQLFTKLYKENKLISNIVEIKYNLITETNSLRHPRIVKFRPDKDEPDNLEQ